MTTEVTFSVTAFDLEPGDEAILVREGYRARTLARSEKQSSEWKQKVHMEEFRELCERS